MFFKQGFLLHFKVEYEFGKQVRGLCLDLVEKDLCLFFMVGDDIVVKYAVSDEVCYQKKRDQRQKKR